MDCIKIQESNEGQVAEIILNRPPANIISAEMMAQIENAVTELSRSPSRKCIVISGDGSQFSYGASVEEHRPAIVDVMLPGFHRMIGVLLKCNVLLIGKVRGLCLGGGFELALACGALFAEENARFGVPEIQLGVFPPVAAALLPFLCGSTRATEIILTGGKYSASAMRDFGLVNKVAGCEDLDQVVNEFISTNLLPRSASSLRIALRASRGALSEEYDRRIQFLEKLYLKELMATEDACEGILAFTEKRRPQWRNR